MVAELVAVVDAGRLAGRADTCYALSLAAEIAERQGELDRAAELTVEPRKRVMIEGLTTAIHGRCTANCQSDLVVRTRVWRCWVRCAGCSSGTRTRSTSGVVERRTHDYLRAGVTSLFAALDIATGKVVGSLRRRHRQQEFLVFLRRIDGAVPHDLDVHLILDNYATDKTPVVKRWLLRNPRFHLHFTRPARLGSTWSNASSARSPTSSSAAVCTAASPPWRKTSARGPTCGTRSHDPTSRPRPPTRSSPASPPTANESKTQHTRGLGCCWDRSCGCPVVPGGAPRRVGDRS